MSDEIFCGACHDGHEEDEEHEDREDAGPASMIENEQKHERSTPTECINLARALLMGPPPPGNLAVPVFSHGSLVAELYTPTGHDPQVPHDRDEIYVAARGTGTFFDGVDRCPVEAGTFMFVRAGQPHRFEDFSPDFAVWVFFFGPSGGEVTHS